MLQENLPKTPLISVITVCFNSEETIPTTISSVLEQTYSNFEYIFVDGNSTDRTLKIINNLKDKRISVKSEADKGIYAAMNKGVCLSKGDIVVILNSDDILADKFVFEKIVKKFQATGADIIYSGIQYFDNCNSKLTTWMPKPFTKGSYKSGFHTPHPGFFSTREMYKLYGIFNEQLKFAADFELMFRFMENECIKCEYLGEITILMRTGGTSSKLVNTFNGMLEIRKVLKEAEPDLNFSVYFLKRYGNKFLERIIKNRFFS